MSCKKELHKNSQQEFERTLKPFNYGSVRGGCPKSWDKEMQGGQCLDSFRKLQGAFP